MKKRGQRMTTSCTDMCIGHLVLRQTGAPVTMRIAFHFPPCSGGGRKAVRICLSKRYRIGHYYTVSLVATRLVGPAKSVLLLPFGASDRRGSICQALMWLDSTTHGLLLCPVNLSKAALGPYHDIVCPGFGFSQFVCLMRRLLCFWLDNWNTI